MRVWRKAAMLAFTAGVRWRWDGRRAMFAAVRVYESVNPGGAEEIARKGQEGLVPLLRQAPGFVEYHLVQASDNTWVSISLFQDRAGAEASARDSMPALEHGQVVGSLDF